MRLTRAAEYAVRCMVFLAERGKGNLACRHEIAELAEIPEHFLAKIAQELARAGFIEIRQGAKGGFILLKDPGSITLLEVVETMIGEIFLNDCVARPSACKLNPSCSVHQVWVRACDQLRTTLGTVTFSQLVQEGACIAPPSDECKE